jgi:hypothetical protein
MGWMSRSHKVPEVLLQAVYYDGKDRGVDSLKVYVLSPLHANPKLQLPFLLIDNTQ